MLIKSFCHLPFELSNCQGGLQCNVLSHFLPHGFHLLLHRLARFSSPTRNGRRARVAAPAPSFGWACPDGSFAMVIFEIQRTLFFLKKRRIWLKSMLELCLKNWGPAEAFAFVHSYLFPLSIPMDFDCQVCKSWYQNLMERSIFMTLTAATIADTSPSLIGVSTPNTVATMIRWSCLFQNDPQSSTPKKAQVLHVLLGFVERPQNSNMALFCETKGLVAHNTKADVL